MNDVTPQSLLERLVTEGRELSESEVVNNEEHRLVTSAIVRRLAGFIGDLEPEAKPVPDAAPAGQVTGPAQQSEALTAGLAAARNPPAAPAAAAAPVSREQQLEDAQAKLRAAQDEIAALEVGDQADDGDA